MSIEMEAPRSRRALLAGGFGGLAALFAAAIGRPDLARAGTDGDVVLGGWNFASDTTLIDNSWNDKEVLMVTSYSGVCIDATSRAPEVPVVAARSETGTAVFGISGRSSFPEMRVGTGVFGYADRDVDARGVYGRTTVGQGVLGEATRGVGVFATATRGTALQVSGKAKFSRCGKANVAKGRKYVDITVAGGLTGRSVVHATLQTHRPGVSIAAVRANYPATGRARIYLTKVASAIASTSVGWFVAEY